MPANILHYEQLWNVVAHSSGSWIFIQAATHYFPICGVFLHLWTRRDIAQTAHKIISFTEHKSHIANQVDCPKERVDTNFPQPVWPFSTSKGSCGALGFRRINRQGKKYHIQAMQRWSDPLEDSFCPLNLARKSWNTLFFTVGEAVRSTCGNSHEEENENHFHLSLLQTTFWP